MVLYSAQMPPLFIHCAYSSMVILHPNLTHNRVLIQGTCEFFSINLHQMSTCMVYAKCLRCASISTRHESGKTSKQPGALTFIVASSEADTMTLKTGWKMTRVTGLRWPLRAYLSGGRGIHSLGSRF